MSIRSGHLNADPLPWLLEPDAENPGIRYFALRNLLGLPEDNPAVVGARADIMSTGPVPIILDAQDPEGYWVRPGGAHSPKYRSTVWQIIFLADFGADPGDERVRQGCEYFLSHAVAANGGYSISRRPAPSTVVHCLNGDPLHALLRLGYASDPRVQSALGWQVSAITGEGGVQYRRSTTSGPGFECAYNLRQPCAWGATKALRALSAIPRERRSSEVEVAIEIGAEFLLGRDLSIADYPYTERINSSWFKFSYPLSYRSDVLETAATLAELGYGDDPRLANALEFILGKQDSQGRWKMEKTLNGKMWADVEQRGVPSKWLTLRALRLMGMAGKLSARSDLDFTRSYL